MRRAGLVGAAASVSARAVPPPRAPPPGPGPAPCSGPAPEPQAGPRCGEPTVPIPAVMGICGKLAKAVKLQEQIRTY